MPRKASKDSMSGAERNRLYRQRVAFFDSYLEAEKERKAKWYAANKEKKAEAQRRYRARKKKENQ